MESLMTLEEVLSSVNGILIGNKEKIYFTSVETDSRNVVKGTLFIPLIGEFQDGHKYVPSALEKGASLVFINNSEYEKNSQFYCDLSEEFEVAIVCVEHTLYALQNLAESYVEKFSNLKKICVTGSCGKTTTKEILVSIFKSVYGDSVVYTKGNFNSETGLPLSVFQIRKNHKIGIFEMGMNRENEIGEISKVLKAQYGIISNIGTAHIGILGSREKIAEEKRKAFNYISKDGAAFVYCADDYADYCLENVIGKKIKYGTEDFIQSINPVDKGVNGTSFCLDGVTIDLPLSGKYNLINALGAISVAREFGITNLEIKTGIENLSAISGRMEIKEVELINNKKITLIMDCYNANPDSMKKSIEFVSNLKTQSKKAYILADMKELGNLSDSSHNEIIELVLNIIKDDDFAVFIGTEMKKACEKVNCKNIFVFENNLDESFKEVSSILINNLNDFDVVMLKGSNSMSLDKIVPLIEKKKEAK